MEGGGEKKRRVRLSHACNLCRARKVRCDERLPSCHNCEVAGVECVTVDPKHPQAEVPRKRVGSEAVTRQDAANFTYQNFVPRTPGSDPNTHSDVTERLRELEEEVRRLRGVEVRTTGTPNASKLSSILNGDHYQQVSYHTPRSSHNHLIEESTIATSATGTIPLDPEIQPLSATSPEEAHLALGSKKRKWMGSSSVQVLTQWLDLYSSARGPGQPLSASFRFGMKHAEEVSLPLFVQLPKLPENGMRSRYIDTYLANVHDIFPVIDVQDFTTNLERFAWLDAGVNVPCDLDTMLPPSDRPILACIYAVISIGIDEEAGETTELGKLYLDAAYSLHAHSVAMPYLSSVQAILLIVLALRLRCKDGAGWNILAQGIRIAYSLGLHRDRSSPQQISTPASQLESRIWWAAFCLESIMSFESGRPCMINVDDCNQIMPSSLGDGHNDGLDFFAALIRLCQVQRKIGARLFGSSLSNKSQGDLMFYTGELDRELLDWADSLPVDVRPGHDIFCPPEYFSFAVFLALQYHQTLTMVHRASLLLDTKIFHRQVDIHCPTSRWKQRIRAGETICLGAARNIVRLLGGNGPRRMAGDLTPPLLAVYALAIYLLKHPKGWSAKADMAQLATAAEYLERRYIEMGQSQDFVRMLGDLVRLVEDRVLGTASTPASTVLSTRINNNASSTFEQDGSGTVSSHGQNALGNSELFTLEDQTGGLMDDLWPRVMGEDLALSALFEHDMYEAGMPHQFFGLPP
ncbi:uncharacterized protein PAC_07684 [Phialocephala subalpina]|uniref:Zn(2)-C6 fungal-type domain-containing protein n=1 Tax=Phialocephala subalpina TaxID=576137 RepID=A0A1L7WYF4_9HELO|nr:uncharacterized protein PAC_07684 [Phialocephala subalpina]